MQSSKNLHTVRFDILFLILEKSRISRYMIKSAKGFQLQLLNKHEREKIKIKIRVKFQLY